MCQMHLRGVGGLDHIKLMRLKGYISPCYSIQACAHLTTSSLVRGTQWFKQAWGRDGGLEEGRKRRQSCLKWGQEGLVGSRKELECPIQSPPCGYSGCIPDPRQQSTSGPTDIHLDSFPWLSRLLVRPTREGSVLCAVSFPMNVAFQREVRERHVPTSLLLLFRFPFQQSNLKGDTDVCAFSFFSPFHSSFQKKQEIDWVVREMQN